MLWQVKTSYFCAGVITDSTGYVREAAPILRWAINKHISKIQDWNKCISCVKVTSVQG